MHRAPHGSIMLSRPLLLEFCVATSLLVVAVLWDGWRDLGLWHALTWSWRSLLVGVVAALPPLCMIPLLESSLGQRLPGLRGLRQSITSVLAPLLGHMRLSEILVLSFLAGLSEEVFFRGVLQREIGLIPASLAFGLLHAVSLPYVLWATVVGCYLGWLVQLSENLWLPIMAHTVVDIVGMWYIRVVVAPQQGQQAQGPEYKEGRETIWP